MEPVSSLLKRVMIESSRNWAGWLRGFRQYITHKLSDRLMDDCASFERLGRIAIA
ncbi:hypothetical protein PAMC26577_14345 [Caballeronia sordidicola]|uniref:Uncharacterized protein n=1 Tax=Caballeronia sordidicola TaxID=196367 RepID=A0A242MVI3_CABSO|nr:hypothetical protein PAMC26577_14345 [Caballeronia sordidicola]